MEKLLTNIISSKYVEKAQKYAAEIGIDGEKKKTVWLTENQLKQLQACFGETPKGYSTFQIRVFGVFNDRGYFSSSKVKRFEATTPPNEAQA